MNNNILFKYFIILLSFILIKNKILSFQQQILCKNINCNIGNCKYENCKNQVTCNGGSCKFM